MKQLYIVGIVLAIVLLVLMGLTKLNTGTPDSIPTIATTTDSYATTTAAESQVPAILTNESTSTATTTTPASMTTTTENTMLVMKTNKGDITIELFTKDMPVTAGNFLKLVQSGYYDGVKFHRIIDGFMIQGGDPLTKDDTMQARWGTGGPGYTIADEFGPRYSNEVGTLSMANAGPNTGGSQFFINTANNTFLDGKHPVFGKVVAGMDVVEVLSKVETGPRDVPVAPVIIEKITVSS
jgi:peptidylprolyl isomerase